MTLIGTSPTLTAIPKEPERVARVNEVVAAAYTDLQTRFPELPEAPTLLWSNVTLVLDDTGHLIVGHAVTLRDLTLRQTLHDCFVNAWMAAAGTGSVTTGAYTQTGLEIAGGPIPITTDL